MQLERELTKIINSLTQRTTQLEDGWRRAPVADRLLATQRLLQSHRLRDGHVRTLEDLNLTVQRLWTDLRRHRKYARDAHDQIRIFALEEELKRVELNRDSFMDAEGLVEELFAVAETFLINRATAGGESFRDLVQQRDRIEARIEAARPAHAPTPQEAIDSFTTQKMAVVYSLTGDIHSAAA